MTAFCFFFFNDTATTEIYTLSLHDALPIWQGIVRPKGLVKFGVVGFVKSLREVPTFLLMRLAFGAGLCRFGMFRAVRGASPGASAQTMASEQNNDTLVRS